MILHAIRNTNPSAAEKESAKVAVHSLRDMIPVNADNENMFRALKFKEFGDIFDKDLVAGIEHMPTYKEYSAAIDQVYPLYKEWRGKRVKPPVPLQPPAAKRSRPDNARTTSGSSRRTRSGKN